MTHTRITIKCRGVSVILIDSTTVHATRRPTLVKLDHIKRENGACQWQKSNKQAWDQRDHEIKCTMKKKKPFTIQTSTTLSSLSIKLSASDRSAVRWSFLRSAPQMSHFLGSSLDRHQGTRCISSWNRISNLLQLARNQRIVPKKGSEEPKIKKNCWMVISSTIDETRME